MNTDNKPNPGPIRRFLDLPPDSVPKTIFIAVTLCLIASMVVSAMAVTLAPASGNQQTEGQTGQHFAGCGAIRSKESASPKPFAAFEPKVLELATGEFAEQFDAATFDDRAAADDPELSIALDNDPALIGRQSKFVTVYHAAR